MANFQDFLPLLLGFEGGFVDDPLDAGGATNKGITLSTFSEQARSLLGIEPTLENLKSLSDEQAAVFYKALFWDKIQGDAFPSQNLANIVCDFFVNSGVHATRLLQAILSGMGANLTVDGSIGPGSLAALGTLDQDEVYRRYKQGRIGFYQDLVQRQPGQARFLAGWLNRVNSFPDV